jgi:hypothetical protein
MPPSITWSPDGGDPAGAWPLRRAPAAMLLVLAGSAALQSSGCADGDGPHRSEPIETEM